MAWVAACQSPAPEAPPPEDTAHTDTHAGADSDGLPLRIIMQRLGANMAGFTQAMLLEEHEQMAAFANDIADHPPMSPAEIERIKETLGQEMSRFVETDEAVHTGALRLKEAVEARDMDLILQRLHELQVGCMACHTSFRQRLYTGPPAP